MAGVEAESNVRQQVFAGGQDAPLEAFLRFLVAFGGECPAAPRRPREARPLVEIFVPEHLAWAYPGFVDSGAEPGPGPWDGAKRRNEGAGVVIA